MRWRVWIEPLPSGSFRVRRRDSAGNNLPSQTCSTKTIANKLSDKWEKALEYRSLGLTDPNKSVAEAYGEYVQEMSSRPPNTLITIQSTVPRYLKDKSVMDDLTRQSLVDFRTELFKTLKPRTIKKYLRHIGAFLSWLVRQGYLDESPFKNIDVPNPKPELRDMYDHELIAMDSKARGDLRLMFRISYTTGMRQANTLGLQAEWIQDNSFIIPRTKSNVPATFPIDPLLVAPLLKDKPKRGALFPEWTRYKLHNAFNVLKASAGVRRRVTWHSAKHTFIKLALKSGLSRPEVQQMVGNLTSQSMDAYTVFEQSGLRARHGEIRFPKLED